jgi:hypothetical protein
MAEIGSLGEYIATIPHMTSLLPLIRMAWSPSSL